MSRGNVGGVYVEVAKLVAMVDTFQSSQDGHKGLKFSG
jgi:hypothetical protein